jgi:hypothetical protein
MMKHLIKQLDLLSWDDSNWRKYAADILCDTSHLSTMVYDHMRSWDPRQVSEKDNGSHNTSTHYKWLVHRDDDLRFTLWLHDYLPNEERGPGYAEVPHNHRYDVCSIVLNGGYTSVLYDASNALQVIEKPTLRSGDVLSLHHNEVHALTEICEGTLTLFIEGPTITRFSTAFYPDGRRRNFVDFPGRRKQFFDRLKSSER